MALCVVCSTEIRDDARFCPSCGASQPISEVAGTDSDPLMGKVVAKKFKVEKLLGVGGMGKVYKARQLSLDKAVVVKVLHDHFREDPQLVQRFQREAKAASRLNHPNSIQIIDFGQDDGGVVFMAMEFLQGQDLFSLIKKDGPLPADRVARVMIQVCSALAEAHEQNVIHRDLKPENIMVEDRRGQRDFVKVLDFGIAKIQDPGEGQQALTQAGMVCGTPEYMSPEQARGLQLDPRSDIYALGVVMYQLATGELPFHADTPIGIVTKHILEKPVPPRQRTAHLNIPPDLEAIILKAMEKEADKRFPTVSDMAEALEQLLRTMGASPAGPPSTNSGFSRPQTASGAAAITNTAGVGAAPGGSSAAVPTKTAPTPQGTGTVNDLAVGGASQPNLEAAPGAGGGIKIAAISFVVVALLGVTAAVVFKNMRAPPGAVDAGVVAVVDAGSKPAVVDAGQKPAVVDAGVVTPPPAMDAGQATPDVKDAGVVVAKRDAGPATIRHKPDAGPRVAHDTPAKGNREKAKALYIEAQTLVAANNCDGAMPKLIEAGKADKTYPEPLKLVAFCAKVAKNAMGACKAAQEYADRKGLAGGPRENWLKQYPCP